LFKLKKLTTGKFIEVLNNAVINYCQSTIGDFNESQLFYDKFNNNGKSFIQWEFTSQHILTLNLTLLLQNGVVNLTEKRADQTILPLELILKLEDIVSKHLEKVDFDLKKLEDYLKEEGFTIGHISLYGDVFKLAFTKWFDMVPRHYRINITRLIVGLPVLLESEVENTGSNEIKKVIKKINQMRQED